MDTERAPLIAVCGAGNCDAPTAAQAEEVGRLLAEAGAILLCGGLGGVMEAAARGARNAGGLTVGLLPGGDRSAANPYIAIPIATGLGEARNVVIVTAADAVIAIAGEYGTLSEIALARKLGKRVVGLGTWSLGAEHVTLAATPEEAVRLALQASHR